MLVWPPDSKIVQYSPRAPPYSSSCIQEGFICSETPTRFGYDALDRLLTVTDALNQVTRYAYDEVDNRISQTDANNHTTRFEYDAAGRMTRRVLPDEASETFAYDLAGNLRSKTDFMGRTISFTYDLANRLKQKTYSDTRSVSFTYTTAGRRATMTDARGTTTYAYDVRDRLAEMAYPDGQKLTYAWDANGNRTELTAHVVGQVLTTQYTYDALNRLDTVTDPRGKVYDHGYDGNGNRTSLVFPNGVQTSYIYDALNRLTELRTRTGVGSVVQSYIYTLGAAGNRTKVEEQDGTTRSYGYDALYRLTNETVHQSGAAVYSKVFTYDPVGNRLQQVHTDASGTVNTTNATFDTRDRQLTRGAQAWTWDANGNLTAKVDEATYAWNFDDGLQSVTLADATMVRHTYGGDSVRVETETQEPNGTTRTVDYLVDTSGPLSQVVAEMNGGALAAYYVRGDDLLAVMRPGSELGTWTSRYYHADGLGSVRALTDESGAVTDRYTFTAFGELIAHEGEDPNGYLFAGEQLDPNSGFYYNRARWMDPQVGRFASLDALLRQGGGGHPYAYVVQMPLDLVDPSGYEPEQTKIGKEVEKQIFAHFTTWAITKGLDVCPSVRSIRNVGVGMCDAATNKSVDYLLAVRGADRIRGRGGRSRPDLALINLRVIFEIKAFASAPSASQDILFYLGELNGSDPGWNAGSPNDYWPPPAVVTSEGIATVFPGAGGAIIYLRIPTRLLVNFVVVAALTDIMVTTVMLTFAASRPGFAI